ncbi:MAG TPA: hemerythrin domain-containing protein [Terriglobales bacterium]|nr:hemerythrin domain-containing protein [Terriglobales bacterium]
MQADSNRRQFLIHTGAASLLPLIPAGALLAPAVPKADEGGEEVTANEDLMREHGVLRRILLIYDHVSSQLGSARIDFDPRLIVETAGIVRRFVEDYHEKLEQDYLFPRFRKAGKLTSLVDTLLEQHQVGRQLTDRIQSLASSANLKQRENAARMQETITKFQTMYRPHAAREDTILFPELKKIISRHEYDSLGDEFEKIEDKQFGEDGFEKMLARVEAIEKQLGIYDLAQFTARV